MPDGIYDLPADVRSRVNDLLKKQTLTFKETTKLESTTPMPKEEPKPWEIPSDLPLWQKGLRGVTMPFNLAQEYAFTPAVATLTQPWYVKNLTPEQQQTYKTESELEHIKAFMPGGYLKEAYHAWEAPGGVKGALEFIPWLFTPGALGAAGKIGKLGKAGQVVAKGIEYSPYGLAEKGIAKVTEPVVKKLTDVLKLLKPTEKIAKALRKEELSKRFGVAEERLMAGEGRVAFFQSKTALRGELPGKEIALAEKFTPEETTKLYNIIRDSEIKLTDKYHAEEGLTKLLIGDESGRLIKPAPHEVKAMQSVFGDDAVKELLEAQSKGGLEKILDVANMPRAILASYDGSGLLRQGYPLVLRFPKTGMKEFPAMFKAAFSEKSSVIIDQELRKLPLTADAIERGLYVAPLPGVGTKLAAREEAYMSSFAEKIPGVKISERGYISVLNSLRVRSYHNIVDMWEKAGQKFTDVDLGELTKLVNWASGRGTLPKLFSQGATPSILNAMFFSPRLIMSRLQLPTLMFSKSPLVRKEAFRMLGTMMGVNTGILSLAALTGVAKIETDPRSADFSKMKVGNTRIDLWAGYAQYARFAAQLFTAQRKSQAGNISTMTRSEVLGRFGQTKMAPAPGLLLDLLKGESYIGEEMALDTESLGKQAWNRLVPLFIQDMADAINQDGLVGGFTAAPGFFGVGVVTHTDEEKQVRDKIAKQQTGLTWDELGRQQGRAAQIKLENESPEIQKVAEEQLKKQEGRTGKFAEWYDQGTAIETSFEKALALAAKEFNATGNGKVFREKVDTMSQARRMMYAARSGEKRFEEIVSNFEKPLTEKDIEKMNPKDLSRRRYYDLMYSDNMYDEFGNYKFEEAEKIRTTFSKDELTYLDEYFGVKREKYPEEYKFLVAAREMMKPYWQIENQVLAQYPEESRMIFDQIRNLEQSDPIAAKRLQFQHPELLMARKRIALMKRQMKMQNPLMAEVLQIFY